ncbi:MAG: protein kinase [Actinomycetes bacterium]|jgi:serine/threonine-protein kinase|nr:protein kinase [Actinomycetes bacterium]
MPTFGQYELRGELGRGAMAVVWRAWDPRLQREVAIKEPLHADGMPQDLIDELNARFLQEGHAVARLNHPNIITVYEAGVFDGRFAIVMELLEGATLAHLIDQRQLTPDQIRTIWFQLLDALAYAHGQGIVHRDVKPDNIFITANGYAKLTDFGVAHVVSSDGGEERIVVGSPGYMAPEQIAGESADARADLFSFSVVAYEMLTLANPFGATEGATRDEIILRTRSSEILPLFSVAPAISAVIARGLRQAPDRRWPTGEQYRRALNEAFEREQYHFLSQKRGRPFALQQVEPTQTEDFQISVPKPTKSATGWLAAGGAAALLLLILAFASGQAGLLIAAMVIAAGGAGIWLVLKGLTPAAPKPAAELGVSTSTPASSPARYAGRGPGLCLTITTPDGAVSTEAVDLPVIIGRDYSVGSTTFSDGLISRQHVRLDSNADGMLCATDLGSRNGTLVNNATLVDPTVLSPGDWLRVGETIIQIGYLQ